MGPTDITYVLRGTIVLVERTFNSFFDASGKTRAGAQSDRYVAVPSPIVSLTMRPLPGTLLADGATIPSPGQSVVVKLLSDNPPMAPARHCTRTARRASGRTRMAGRDSSSASMTASTPASSPLIDPGAYSEIRILGIPGNQTTGQQRVPVIMTSLRDDTVGVIARGVKEYDIFNSWPTQNYLGNPNYVTQNLTTPEPGDGGYIYIGGNSMTEYDPTNPLISGSFIDNADISYMTPDRGPGSRNHGRLRPAARRRSRRRVARGEDGYGYWPSAGGEGFFGPPGGFTDPNARSPSSIRRWHSRSPIPI